MPSTTSTPEARTSDRCELTQVVTLGHGADACPPTGQQSCGGDGAPGRPSQLGGCNVIESLIVLSQLAKISNESYGSEGGIGHA